MMMFVVSFQIERDKLLKEQQAHEEAVREKEELERRLQEFQEEANRAKDALVGEIQNKQASKVIPQTVPLECTHRELSFEWSHR